MNINGKVSTTLVLGSGVILLLVVALSFFSFREFSLLMAKDHIRTAAEVVRVHLTESMVNGSIGRREAFFARLAEVDALLTARVIRGPKVEQQFGIGLSGENLRDSIEQQVISSGDTYFHLSDEGSAPILRGTIPFVATSRGSPNCLECHKVKEGDVLGAITISLSMEAMQDSAIKTVLTTLLIIFIFTVISVVVSRRVLRPLVVTAAEIQGVTSLARQGDFSGTVSVLTQDEIGSIATDLNALMSFLREGLGEISRETAALMHYELPHNSNLLATTIEMVEVLVDVAHFKQAIEEDETKREVFNRLTTIWSEQFGVSRYSLYEVSPSLNRIYPLSVNGEEQAECRYCDPNILLRADTCRCRRTGHDVDGIEQPHLCAAFRPGDEGELMHYCIPIIQAGVVGSVAQLLSPKDEAVLLRRLIPFIRIYLNEAGPVIETKRLMETLRESTLRDPMTGLHNRRFLEEYVETMIASTSRSAYRLSILMLDVDYFKNVNDTYGHEVGDTVLKTIANIFADTVRANDMVIRYGGEEFMIILQDSSGVPSTDVAEKIRKLVEGTTIQLKGTVVKKTVSIGIAVFPDDSDSFWQVVKFADVALYKAKEQGRNRVLNFLPSMWEHGE